jgi:hypothetical protein
MKNEEERRPRTLCRYFKEITKWKMKRIPVYLDSE